MRSNPIAKNRKPNPYPGRLYLTFALLALFSTIGLDYAAARRGEKAYFFSFPTARKEAAVAPVPLADSVRRFLGTSGIRPESIEELEDTDGTPRIVVYLPLKDYESLEPRLDKELRDKRASVDKEKKDEEGLTSYTWRIAGPPEESLSLVFSLLMPAAEKKEEEKEEKVAPPSPPENRVAIIIDDMGSSLEALQEVCDLGQPVTISILPLSPFAEETARIAHENGLEVMLHLPGESLSHQEGNNSTAGLIKSGMNEEDIRSLVEESLSRVPYVEGVNNHMGSKITQEEPVMRPILDLLKSRDLYFLDSRTTAGSIAFDLARKMGLRTAYRNIFLDSSVGLDFSKKKIIDLFRLSQKTGKAIGIGHPFPETLQALRENIHLLKKYKVRPVFASEIIQE
jgi:polysaccharide deacetylase 2 family uncharacterized protein YibQ